MTNEILLALKEYINAVVDEKIASNEEGADGYRQAAVSERKNREKSWEKLEYLVKTHEAINTTLNEIIKLTIEKEF